MFDLLLVTDEAVAHRAGRSVVETVAWALRCEGAGRVAVLLRERDSAEEQVERSARTLLPVVEAAGARLLVHTHAQVATCLGLFGVHMAAGAFIEDARRRLAPGALVGASRHAGDRLDESALEGIDYVIVAPVFRPTSKPADARPTLGLEGLSRAVNESTRPVVALGGISVENAAACMRAGASAIAVLGGVMAAVDPACAVRGYLDAIARGRGDSFGMGARGSV